MAPPGRPHAPNRRGPARFGGYDKLSKVYELRLETVHKTVDLIVEIIGKIHKFLGSVGNMPQWLAPRGADGGFEVEKLL